MFDFVAGMGRGRPPSRRWRGCCLGLIPAKTLNHGERNETRIHVWFNQFRLVKADTDTSDFKLKVEIYVGK